MSGLGCDRFQQLQNLRKQIFLLFLKDMFILPDNQIRYNIICI